MDIRAIDFTEAQTGRAPDSARSPLPWLHDLALDLLLLQRQLVLALTDSDSAGEGGATALMAACCISERLAQGYALLQKRGVETAAIATFRRYFDDADAVVRRLRAGGMSTDASGLPAGPAGETAYGAELIRGLGTERMLRLARLDTPAARTAKAVLFAADLFLVAAHQLLAAVAPRHEPETSEAFDQQLAWHDRADTDLALTA